MELERTSVLLTSSAFVQSWSTSGPRYLEPVDGGEYTYLYQNIFLHGHNFARIVLNDYDYPYRDSDLPVVDFFRNS